MGAFDGSNLDPTDWDAVRAQGRRMLDEMIDHMQGLRDGPVWREPPADLRAGFREPLPTAGSDLEAVYARFADEVLPYSSGNAHPAFMGWVQGGGTVVGMLAEMLSAGMNSNLGGRDHMPLEVEQQVLAWTRQIFGFPPGAGGLFLTGTSQANFLGVLIARNRALGPQSRTEGVDPAFGQLTAYASSAVHGCVGAALDMAGIGSGQLRRVAVGPDHAIRLDALQAAIAADRAKGFRPFCLVGSAGTVDVGAVDDLAGLADVAAREGLHFHVDGAFGALAMLAPKLAPRLAGIERADSIGFDWHKWGQVPYDAGFILVRDGDLQRRTFAGDDAYLRRSEAGLAGGDWWPCDYGPDLSRSFRALKTWFTLKTFGTEALGASIQRTCDLAAELGVRVAAEPELELLAPVQLNIVCFRYRGAAGEVDALNEAIVGRLHMLGLAAPSLTRIDGKTAIRAAIVNHRTDRRDIAALADQVLKIGRGLAGEQAA
ncbi:MAG: pyridoxal phosphate-dependent decarboxylase family protein [Phenylobacterium sp.]